MTRSATAAWLLALAALAVLLSRVEPELHDPVMAGVDGSLGNTRDLLPGAWLREYDDAGHQVRRVLRLDATGNFRESVRVVNEAGGITEFENTGFWMYDGINLKRKYTSLNGSPPSRLNLPFATFQLSFDSRDEFKGVDHVHHREVRYRRID
ncbi:hypothetical protein [Ramlibacter albus]|uniref:Uncharacterized protein n=1 Tax=Ramlibacter albus TaxID=2079448 RepID=A0A923S7N3_9BURK|nr:hypothetical protein [Ramlibacter albus]MBC5767287.1 hypothetical protein [Ramlibacter albus]